MLFLGVRKIGISFLFSAVTDIFKTIFYYLIFENIALIIIYHFPCPYLFTG